MDEEADTEAKLRANLVTLDKLEAKIRRKHNDRAVFERIDLYRQSLRFHIEKKDWNKAIHESNCMTEFIIPLMDDFQAKD